MAASGEWRGSLMRNVRTHGKQQRDNRWRRSTLNARGGGAAASTRREPEGEWAGGRRPLPAPAPLFRNNSSNAARPSSIGATPARRLGTQGQQSGAAESVSSQRPRISNIDIDEAHVLADGTQPIRRDSHSPASSHHFSHHDHAGGDRQRHVRQLVPNSARDVNQDMAARHRQINSLTMNIM